MSSITTSMSISGFDDKFLFYGFLPKKEGELEKVLSVLSKYKYSQIFFIPSLKINFYLKKFKQYYLKRNIVIAKEITKIHEEFFREKIEDLSLFKVPIKGELTVVISDSEREAKVIDKEKIINKAKKFLKKYSLRDTVDLILETEKLNKKEIYKMCLNLKNEKIT